MDHDAAKENWSRVTNRYCDCPPWRYSPRHPKPSNPDCPQHGTATNDLIEQHKPLGAHGLLFYCPDGGTN